MSDQLKSKFGPLVSTEPCALPDTTFVVRGKYITLENLREDHFSALWRNFDLTGAGSFIEDYLPGPRTDSIEKLKEDLHGIAEDGVITYAVLADPKCLGPGQGNVSEHTEVLGVIHYDARPGNREIEVGIINSKALHRTYAATEAHYLWLRNVCDPNSPGVIGGKSLPYRKVCWRCNSLNAASKRCAERIGYVHEGRIRKNMIAKGRSRDTDLYGFVDEEWPKIKEALEIWLGEENFDEEGKQRMGLVEIRMSLP